LLRTNDYVITREGYNVDDVGIGPGTIEVVGNYDTFSGTSMATPHVTGAVALAAMAFPSESAADRKARILNNVDPLYSLTGLVATGGRLNLSKVVSGGTDNLLRWPDFNSDANYDLIWRNYSTGANAVWYMDGITRTGSDYLDSLTDTNWRIVGTPDMNGDGKPDILWRNYSTGDNVVWYMDGITKTGYAYLDSLTDTNWRIVGTPDMNGDGKLDILWRNYSTGDNVVWYMNGISKTGDAYLDSVTDTNWRIVATPDVNLDGKPDILWRHYSTGANVVWYMNGIIRTGYAYLSSVTDTNWFIGNNADF
jgi:subtilisin family serine protease